MRLHRLRADYAESWRLWPDLEQRVRLFCDTDATDTNADQLIALLRERFIKMPDLLGVWLGLDDDAVIGHLVSWVEVLWGTPVIFVHQAKIDAGYAVGESATPMIDAMRCWIEELNWAYEQAKSPYRIRTVQFATERHPDVWRRYLERLAGTVIKQRTVLSWKLL